MTAPHLTPRESAVLHGISEGFLDKEVAESLAITTRAVRFHVENLFAKFGARNRIELLHRSGYIRSAPILGLPTAIQQRSFARKVTA